MDNNISHTQFRILIVDYDDEQHRLEKEILEAQNHLIVEAKYGKDALEILKWHEFDALLINKKMPLIDSDEICYQIRHELHLKLLPILIIGENETGHELVKSLNAGANDFISKPVSPSELIARINAAANLKRATDQLDNVENMLFTLSRTMEARDENTGEHCIRLTYAAEVFGRKLGLDKNELSALKRGGILHDIGKLGIPDKILLKAGKLDSDEWEVMKTHTTIGYHMCNNLRGIQTTTPIILCHHERWDGSGYPQQLRGNEIPLLAQVFQLIDIYDALAYDRPYKSAFPIENIIRIIKEEISSGWRNPELANEFIELIEQDHESLLMPEDYAINENQKVLTELRAIC